MRLEISFLQTTLLLEARRLLHQLHSTIIISSGYWALTTVRHSTTTSVIVKRRLFVHYLDVVCSPLYLFSLRIHIFFSLLFFLRSKRKTMPLFILECATVSKVCACASASSRIHWNNNTLKENDEAKWNAGERGKTFIATTGEFHGCCCQFQMNSTATTNEKRHNSTHKERWVLVVKL